MKSYGEQRCDFWYTSTFIPIKIFLAVAGSNLRHETMHRQMENENQWWLPGDVLREQLFSDHSVIAIPSAAQSQTEDGRKPAQNHLNFNEKRVILRFVELNQPRSPKTPIFDDFQRLSDVATTCDVLPPVESLDSDFFHDNF